MQTISVLGLGIIGGVWARHLQADGLTVRAWNRTPQPELSYFVSDPVQAIAGADLIILVVADPQAVGSVLNTIAPHLTPNQVVVQSSTISAKWTKEFAAMVQKTGASYLEAPFTGSKPAAEARQIVYYLGGDPAVVLQAEPILSRLSRERLYIGPLGTASSLKLAMNLNIAGVMQTMTESLVLARAEGITDDVYFQALKLNVSRSGLVDLKETKLRENDFSPQFSLKHMGKDLRLALETANELDLPQTKHLKALYDKALDLGWGNEDFIVLMKFWADHAR